MSEQAIERVEKYRVRCMQYDCDGYHDADEIIIKIVRILFNKFYMMPIGFRREEFISKFSIPIQQNISGHQYWICKQTELGTAAATIQLIRC